MSLFDALLQAGHLRPLDQALAATLRRQDGDTSDLVQAGAALASLAVAQGHAAFDPSRPERLLEAALPWPALAEWDAALASSPWVARAFGDDPTAQAPLAFDNGLLYLRRYREYEHRLAARLRSLAAQAPALSGAGSVGSLFDVLFPGGSDDDRQAEAARLALRRALLLVTGGPGTGKTTTITRLLLLLVAQVEQAVVEGEWRLRRRVVAGRACDPRRRRQRSVPFGQRRPRQRRVQQPLRPRRIERRVALRHRQRRQGRARQHQVGRVAVQPAQRGGQRLVQRPQVAALQQGLEQAHAAPPANSASSACTSPGAGRAACRPPPAARPRQNR